jgi:hypothetical protein
MKLILPWLATLGFCCAVFLVGKYLQAGEKKKVQKTVDKANRLQKDLSHQGRPTASRS